MRRYFFEFLATLLLGGSLVFFYQCTSFLTRRDYVGGALLALIGIGLLTVGSGMARLALFDRK